jgi:glycosyltransferase involved in cell wall biosynthesis
MRLGILTSHPIQYQAPWFRGLAKVCDLEVFFAHCQSAAEQGKAGFGVAFEWDVDLLSGYKHQFMENKARKPDVSRFFGCDTPEIREIISGKRPSEVMEPALHGAGKAESRKQPNEIGGLLDYGIDSTGQAILRASACEVANQTSQAKEVRGQSSVVQRPFDAFIVTGWYLKSHWQATRACHAAGVPVLVRGDSQLLTPRSRLKQWVKEMTYRWLLRQFDGFLYVGQRNREYLEHYGVPAEKLFFAPHFVDNEFFRQKAEKLKSQKAEIRKEWGANDSGLVALFVGKFQPPKRPGDIIKAMAIKQKAESRKQKSLVVFVGSGELENELRALAVREDVRVHFAGFKNQSELPSCYAAADVLVLPSDNDTWGLVVNEAMACGTPAIVSNAVGCAPDMIEEGKTGFTFPAGDADALAERLAKLAQMKHSGHDFTAALAEKMRIYCADLAVSGTIHAVESVALNRHD